jgi:hypothetical protein
MVVATSAEGVTAGDGRGVEGLALVDVPQAVAAKASPMTTAKPVSRPALRVRTPLD